jgi:hypothetical protein
MRANHDGCQIIASAIDAINHAENAFYLVLVFLSPNIDITAVSVKVDRCKGSRFGNDKFVRWSITGTTFVIGGIEYVAEVFGIAESVCAECPFAETPHTRL